MMIAIRCGICDQVFEVDTYSNGFVCTRCGAERVWISDSAFAWKESQAIPPTVPRKTLLHRRAALV